MNEGSEDVFIGIFLRVVVRLTIAPRVAVVLDCHIVDKYENARSSHESQVHIPLLSMYHREIFGRKLNRAEIHKHTHSPEPEEDVR